MRFLVALAVIAITVYSVIDCVRAEDRQRRGLPAWLWVTVIIVLPGVGGLVWLLVSRTAPDPRPRRPRPTRPVAPDDDPDFLAGLARQQPRETPQAPSPDVPEKPAQDASDADDAGPDQQQEGDGHGEGDDQPSRDDRGRHSPE
ncbi:MAG TPA: PLD nuclease N-terminal domain-containing protein [Candidatus Ruania gallistercoris]|uniref:PLD nuclease N-terminal domain-containing protein n=1 Tax=Candidatus Ruania gallistercoris TaxID=2838746 RepID=A0A9D2EFY1_9MICO|nr:PLD nuclease N-terminal domain-containing protein [Candidatus Ruania gallistercoris]